MKDFLGLFLIALASHEAHALQRFETTSPATRPSAARVYREMPDAHGVLQNVLVVDTKIPGPARLEIDLDAPILFQYYLNDRNQVVQNSNPYFATRILSFPESPEISPAERQRLLSGTFYFGLYDLNPSRIISNTFKANLPAGGRKPILALPWDTYNPKGTWGYAIENALLGATNAHMVNTPPPDMIDFCPKFASLSRDHRIHFWQSLVTHVSELESGFIPYCASDEGKYNPESKGVISSGLVQISLLSVKNACYQARGCNVIENQESMFDPAKNLHCGVAVMSCLVNRGNCISCKTAEGKWTGIAAYWSTLRDPHIVPCPSCQGGQVRVGYKPEIQAKLKKSAAYCF